MLGHIVGHGSASGVPIRMRVVQILEMRDGKVIRAYHVAGPAVSGTGLSD